MALWVNQNPTAGCCGGNWLTKKDGMVWKGADAKTVNRGLIMAERREIEKN